MKKAIDHPFNISILTTWIWSRWLQRSIKSSSWRSTSIYICSTASIRYKYTSFSKRKRSLPNPQSTYIPHWQFLSASPPPQHSSSFLLLDPPSPFHLLILTPEDLRPVSHRCTWLKKASSLCVIWQLQSGAFRCLCWSFIHYKLVLSLRSWVYTRGLPPFQPKTSSKGLSPSIDGLEEVNDRPQRCTIKDKDQYHH